MPLKVGCSTIRVRKVFELFTMHGIYHSALLDLQSLAKQRLGSLPKSGNEIKLHLSECPSFMPSGHKIR